MGNEALELFASEKSRASGKKNLNNLENVPSLYSSPFYCTDFYEPLNVSSSHKFTDLANRWSYISKQCEITSF